MFHVKQGIEEGLSNNTSFQLEAFDYRLLPLFLSNLSRKTFLVFDDKITDCYDGLSLFLGDRGVFINSDLLGGKVAPKGFSGWGGVEKDRFFSSLSSGFSNHQFIVLPFSLYRRPAFPKYRLLKEFVVNKKTLG